MKDYGRAIKILRNMYLMTQSELASKLNVSSQAVSKWENGLSLPNIDTIMNIVEIFNMSLDEFASLVINNQIPATKITKK